MVPTWTGFSLLASRRVNNRINWFSIVRPTPVWSVAARIRRLAFWSTAAAAYPASCQQAGPSQTSKSALTKERTKMAAAKLTAAPGQNEPSPTKWQARFEKINDGYGPASQKGTGWPEYEELPKSATDAETDEPTGAGAWVSAFQW